MSSESMAAFAAAAEQPDYEEPAPTWRERPILFSGEMVRAILDGRKTMTRRVVKPQPVEVNTGNELRGWVWLGRRSPFDSVDSIHCNDFAEQIAARCPYGNAGDRLWVRESFQIYHEDGAGGLSVICPTGARDRDGVVKYMADSTETQADREAHGTLSWRPSIHMPRDASRLTLEITEVRVERIQDATREDAVAEGVEGWGYQDSYTGDCDGQHPEEVFRDLWNTLNEKRGYGWDVNPWVWVIGFRRIEQNDVSVELTSNHLNNND